MLKASLKLALTIKLDNLLALVDEKLGWGLNFKPNGTTMTTAFVCD